MVPGQRGDLWCPCQGGSDPSVLIRTDIHSITASTDQYAQCSRLHQYSLSHSMGMIRIIHTILYVCTLIRYDMPQAPDMILQLVLQVEASMVTADQDVHVRVVY